MLLTFQLSDVLFRSHFPHRHDDLDDLVRLIQNIDGRHEEFLGHLARDFISVLADPAQHSHVGVYHGVIGADVNGRGRGESAELADLFAAGVAVHLNTDLDLAVLHDELTQKIGVIGCDLTAGGFQSMGLATFSKEINRQLDCQTVAKRINGKRVRVFVK